MTDPTDDAHLELALEIAGLGMWSWDLRSGTGELDARGAAIVGLPPGPLPDVAAAQRARVHPDDLASLDRAIAAGIAGGEAFDLDYRVLRENGQVGYVASRARVITDDQGRPVRLVGTNRDVTEDRRAAAALRDSELRYRTLFESIDEGFCIASVILDEAGRPVDYRIDELNPAYERHSGLRDATGRTAREMVPDIEDIWIETYGRVALTGEAAHLTHHSAALGRWFDVKAFRIGEPGTLRIAILFDDITERIHADQERERQLERERSARAAAEAFLAVMSHELRTPVTSIYGSASLLSRDRHGLDVRGLAEDIAAEAERLRRIIDDLMVLSGVDRGFLHLSPEPVLLHHVVAEVVADVRRRYPEATISLEVPSLGPVLADLTAIRQVLYNLVGNAAKYAGRAGPITVVARRVEDAVEVAVLDLGPGLGSAPEALFELFYRAPGAAERASGSGIGLYVVRALLDAMGSGIVASNRSAGGASFAFRLPTIDPDEADPDVLRG